MRAVQISGPGESSLVDLPDAKPGDGEVRVRVLWAAVCATDRKLTERGVAQPRVPGHEVAGVLDDGTVVGLHPDIPCGRCHQCARGWGNRCPLRQAVGIDRDGGFAEWLVVPAAHAVPVPDVEPELVPLLEPLSCCLHATDLLDARSIRRAVVVGAGSMGVLGMWALQAHGIAVAVMDPNPDRRAAALGLGADARLSPDDDPASALGGPVEAALVTAPGAEALAWAAEQVDVGGVVHAFAGTPGGAPLDANLVHYRHLRVLGSTGSRLADYARAHALAASGAVELDRMPRTVITLNALPAALSTKPDSGLRTLVQIGGGAL
jgi:L-iditol 2-dehydrogenase